MRFDDAELSLVKGLFADNDDLLFAVRKVMLQFPLSEAEEISVKKQITDEAFKLLSKFFLPELDPDAPLFQLVDMQLGLQNDMKTLGIDAMIPQLAAKDIEMRYIAQQLEQLEDVTRGRTPLIKLSLLAQLGTEDKEEEYINILARNYILSYVDSNLQQIKMLAGEKKETVQQTIDRLQKNSNK